MPAVAPRQLEGEARLALQRARHLGHHVENVIGLGKRPAVEGRVQPKIRIPFSKKPPTGLPGVPIVDILKEVERYNSLDADNSKASLELRQKALKQLSLVEHLIYGWFGQQNSIDLDSEAVNRKMKALMNGAQAERRTLVGLSIKGKDGVPPVANFDELPKLVQDRVTLLWQRLLANKGIAIQDDGKGFRETVLSDFARLLETPMGRRLVGGIMFMNKGLQVVPTTMKGGKFVASPLEYENEGFKKVDPKTVDVSQFVSLDFRSLNPAQRLDAVQDIRLRFPKSPGVKITSEKGDAYFEFGEGTGSRLPVPKDANDAMPAVSSRMVDEQGREIIAPTFINLGHELGHVLRSAQGLSASKDGQALIDHGFSGSEGSDRPEEFFNIGGIENSLRLESGIVPRFGHGNLYSRWGIPMLQKIQKVEDDVRDLRTQLDLDLKKRRQERKSEPKPSMLSKLFSSSVDTEEQRILQQLEALKKIEEQMWKLTRLIQDLLNGKGSISKILQEVNFAVSEARLKLKDFPPKSSSGKSNDKV